MDVVVKGGTVVTSEKTYVADVGIVGEKIAGISPNLSGERSLDARGLYVFPGFIDAHVHIEMCGGDITTSDDWESGTIAAAHGGTTTVIDFSENVRGDDLGECVRARRSMTDGHAVIDYNLHLSIADADESNLRQLPGLAADGYTSAKIYTTYEPIRLEDGEILRALAAARESGIMTLVHVENHHAIEYLTERLLSEGKTAPRYHPVSRPPAVEAEAANRVVILADLVGAPICIAHLSTADSLEIVRAARARGQRVYAEVCPQHLLLSELECDRPGFEGAKFVLSPPLRAAAHMEALWAGLAQGDLDIVSTDHCSWNFSTQKVLGKDSFAMIPNGAPGIETRIPLMYSEGVREGRLSLQRFVEVCATAPAQLFGLYPRKGTIAVGSDADLVLFDPDCAVVLTQGSLHQQVDYCPYEGMTVRGYPHTVLCRGSVVVRENEFVGEVGWGRYVPAKPFPAEKNARPRVQDPPAAR